MPECAEQDAYIFDSKRNLSRKGHFTGAVLIKPKYPFEAIILADNLNFDEKISVKEGLLLGVHQSEALAREVNFESTPPFQTVEYAVQINPEIIEAFDQGSIASTFPYTISFLHTALLWNQSSPQYTVDHLDLVRGEILARPVACDIDGGMIIGDRLVINQIGDPMFYNCFIVSRNDNLEIAVEYDPMRTVGERFLKYIIIIGSENLKKPITK